MNEEAALLRAICEHPDEDTPRLVFADWLTEQGSAVNVAWASGIRAQVWLARGSTDEALRFQACVFDSRYGLEKLHERLELPPCVGEAWDRGFPSDVSGQVPQLSSEWPGLAFRIPIRRLFVYEMNDDDAAGLITWPALTVLRELSCAGMWNSPRVDVIGALAGCENLRNLKALHLQNVLVDDDTAAALLNSPHLAGLEKLRIGYEGSLDALSNALKDRLIARFSADVYDESIPF